MEFMVLIPKKPGAVDVDAFRPICLQNCSLKILSKVLTRRLQDDIPNLIDLRQTGFIKGRFIADTFVYAAELIQVCHKRKKPAVVLKLDFAKAFDTVNWEGMFRVMQARRFSELWINWMKVILNTSKSAVLVNGCPGPWITCKRGLRQGDPISPYLFLLVAETLQCMIQGCLGIQHPTEEGLPCAVLQYADDTLIVLKGDVNGVSHCLFSNRFWTGLPYCRACISTMQRALWCQFIWRNRPSTIVSRSLGAEEKVSHSLIWGCRCQCTSFHCQHIHLTFRKQIDTSVLGRLSF
jgi:hypothetical protein